MSAPASFNEGRARVQLRQFAWTMLGDGSLHGPESKRLYKWPIPATVTIGGTVRLYRVRLQAALATAMLDDGAEIANLPRSAEALRPLIAEAVTYAREHRPHREASRAAP